MSKTTPAYNSYKSPIQIFLMGEGLLTLTLSIIHVSFKKNTIKSYHNYKHNIVGNCIYIPINTCSMTHSPNLNQKV